MKRLAILATLLLVGCGENAAYNGSCHKQMIGLWSIGLTIEKNIADLTSPCSGVKLDQTYPTYTFNCPETHTLTVKDQVIQSGDNILLVFDLDGKELQFPMECSN